MKKSNIIILLLAIPILFFFLAGFYTIPPIGAIPEGGTAIVWRIGSGDPFFNSPDAYCIRTTGGISILCRGMALAAGPTERVILALPYQHWAYSASTVGLPQISEEQLQELKQSAPSQPTSTPKPKMRTIRYVLEGSRFSSASVTIENASGNTEQFKTRFPYENEFKVPYGQFVYISAQLKTTNPNTIITCQIFVDGILTEEAQSKGNASIASCSGQAK